MAAWAADVRTGAFPSDAESYHLPASSQLPASSANADMEGLYGGSARTA
jgi:hypothetical protein